MINEHQNRALAKQIILKERNLVYKISLYENERQLRENEQEIKKLQTQLEINNRFIKSMKILNERKQRFST